MRSTVPTVSFAVLLTAQLDDQLVRFLLDEDGPAIIAWLRQGRDHEVVDALVRRLDRLKLLITCSVV